MRSKPRFTTDSRSCTRATSVVWMTRSSIAAGLTMAALLQTVAAQEEDVTFFVIGKHGPKPSGDDKTSLLLSCRNEAGGLHALLSPLAAHAISMTRIESRPSRRRKWDYVFFVDIDGHAEDDGVREALEEMSQNADLFRVLGAYPKAVG